MIDSIKKKYLDHHKENTLKHVEEVAESLEDACYFYIKYQFDNNLLLMPHQWIKDAYEDLSKSV